MTIQASSVARLMEALRLTTPVIALYEGADSTHFEPLIRAQGRACCFAYYPRWVAGETLLVERVEKEDFAHPQHGCPGLQRGLGIGAPYPSWMPHFLTDGKNGAPMGEGLKASPELAAAFLERSTKAPKPLGPYLLLGPLRVEHWDKVKSLTLFADPDRLSALMTLASFHSSDPDEIAAPFSSGCGLLFRELSLQGRDRAILSCTDLAMRRYLPPELLSLTVSPTRFMEMLDFPDDCFLYRAWWAELLKARQIG